MTTIPAIAGIAVFALALLWAAICDARTLKIPNGIPILMTACYVVLAPLAGFSLRDIGSSVATAAVATVMLFAFFARGLIGGGDAKLMAATVLWLGVGQLLPFLLWTSLFGGVLAACALVFRAIPLKTAAKMPGWVRRMLGQSAGIPLAVSISAAGLARLQSSPWMLAAP